VPGAETTHLVMRRNAAELARSTDRAQAALAAAGKYFAKQTPEANYAPITCPSRRWTSPCRNSRSGIYEAAHGDVLNR
jgi:hypothetical protein